MEYDNEWKLMLRLPEGLDGMNTWLQPLHAAYADANKGVPREGGMQRAVIAVGYSHTSYPFTFLTGRVRQHRNAC